jgi:hypothetical protein
MILFRNMRALVVLFGCAVSSCALVYGCSSSPTEQGQPSADAGKTDAKSDVKTDSTLPGDDGFVADADAEPEAPPPIENDGDLLDEGPPPAGSRVEKTIGAAGGTLAGAMGTPLAGVVLEVPAGALASDMILAIEVTGGAPPGGMLVSPVVNVGPEGTLFAKPARLTLPWSSTSASPSLGMLSKIGLSWSSLLDPSGDAAAKTLTASMTRASGAAVIALDLSGVTPKIDVASPADAGAGATIFLEGSGFGPAPVWRAGSPELVSGVTIGGAAAQTLAWADDAITVRGTTTGAIVVTTPGGTATSP